MALDRLLQLAGEWRGRSTLQDPEMGLQPDTSESTLMVSPLLDGRFVRMDYTWSYHGKPQSGSMLIGSRTKTGAASVHWIDSWHNGESVMACEGAETDGGIDVRGSYAAPPGPDWGWRIAITANASGSLAIVMHNISPEGREQPAVEGQYSRADA
jgi:hypothetical protein